MGSQKGGGSRLLATWGGGDCRYSSFFLLSCVTAAEVCTLSVICWGKYANEGVGTVPTIRTVPNPTIF